MPPPFYNDTVDTNGLHLLVYSGTSDNGDLQMTRDLSQLLWANML